MGNANYFPIGSMETSFAPDLNPPVLTFVGRLGTSDKGVDIFLRAVEALADCRMPFSAWIVGGSFDQANKLLDDLKANKRLRRLHQSGRIILWQRIDPMALPEIYSRSSLVVMPSRRETFGIVAIQAMACGTPVIATCVGGLKHTVLDGIAGQLIRSEDSTSLAMGSLQIMQERIDRRTLSENAHALGSGHISSLRQRLTDLKHHQNGRKLHPHPAENVGYYLYSKAVDHIRKAYGQDADLKLLSRKRHYVGKLRRANSQPQTVLKLFRESDETDHSLFDITSNVSFAHNRLCSNE